MTPGSAGLSRSPPSTSTTSGGASTSHSSTGDRRETGRSTTSTTGCTGAPAEPAQALPDVPVGLGQPPEHAGRQAFAREERGPGAKGNSPTTVRNRKAEAVQPHAGGDRRARHRKGRGVDGGILLLDELPEFSQSVLDVLRQPLERGAVTLCRATGGSAFLPRPLPVWCARARRWSPSCAPHRLPR